MKSTFDIETILFQRIMNSGLKDVINGGVYKRRRPTGSQLEDIVINSLPVDNEQLQRAVGNVNIHVPDVTIEVNGVQDKQANDARLSALTTQALALLTDVWEDDFHYDVQQQHTFPDEDASSHYSNIRIDFFNINLT